jgi:catechol 2,3-dioxygenase-like lactoylglutathione lyase family enzyme
LQEFATVVRGHIVPPIIVRPALSSGRGCTRNKAVALAIQPCLGFHGQNGERQMPDFKWDHVHLRTPDPEATAQWFERMFGAEIIRSTQQGKPRVDIRLGGALIFTAQVSSGDGVNPAPVTPYQGLDHFGLAVSGIDAIAADLRKKGVEFTQEPHSPRPGIKICFLRGPQGISIELLDRDPKYS